MNEEARPGDDAPERGSAIGRAWLILRRGTLKKSVTVVAVFGVLLLAAGSCRSFPSLAVGPPAPEALLGPVADTMAVRFSVHQLLDPSMRSTSSIPGTAGDGSALLPEPRKPWLVETGGTIASRTLLFDYQNPANYVGLRYFPAYTSWEMYQVEGGVERRLHTWLIDAKNVGTVTVARTETELILALGDYRTRISLRSDGGTEGGVDSNGETRAEGQLAAPTFIGIADPPETLAPTDFYDVRF